MQKKTIKVKTFSQHKLIDVNDFYQRVYDHLVETGQGFCFHEGRIISMETCLEHGAK